MRDTNVDHHTAVKTMWRSGNYGTATFPHDDLDVYDEMIAELLPSHIPDPPNALLSSVPSSFNETCIVFIGETADPSSDDQYGAITSHHPSADLLLGPPTFVVSSDVAGDAGSSPLEEGDTGAHVNKFSGDRVRRRKVPRGSIPTTQFELDESADDLHPPAWKKSRLA